jgi:1,4-dihydroxy-2-naphthoate octaprenyltransferase
MTKFGWKTGMSLHNLFLLTTFLLYGLASIIGLSEKLALPALVSFPIACIQFWEMWRISEGYKPRWKLLKISSLGSISILAYFLLFILWLR